MNEYHHMIRTGLLAEDDPVELLEGWVVFKMPRGPRHDATVDKAGEAIKAVLPAGWRLRGQSAITTADSEPEPDLAVVLGPADRYVSRHPGSADITLVIEVADSSLSSDRDDKGPLYARAGLPFYWVLNLVDDQVEVDSDPVGGDNATYRRRDHYRQGDAVPVVIEPREVARIPVRSLLAG